MHGDDDEGGGENPRGVTPVKNSYSPDSMVKMMKGEVRIMLGEDDKGGGENYA